MHSSQSPTANLELRDYMSILRRRRALIVLITALAVLVAVGWSLTRTPMYQAGSQVLLQGRQIDLLNEAPPVGGADAIRTEISYMSSGQMRNAIRRNLGYLPEPTLRAAPQISPGVLITVSSPDAEQATKEANDFANAYVAERRKMLVLDITASIDELNQQNNNLIIEAANGQEQLQTLAVQFDRETDPAKRRLLEAQIQQLSVQIDPSAVAARRASIQQNLDRLTTAQASILGGGRYDVAESRVPEEPYSPQPVRTAGLAFAGGLALGLAAAFVRDYYDDTLRTKEDLDAVTGGLPVLGIIPAIDEWRDRKAALLEAVSHPNSAASEAYRSLRTSIEFISVDQKIDIIHVTSSTSGEGKSTTSANMAVTLARAGKRVILIDCDLRRPRLHQFFGMDNSIGFTSVVLGSTRIEDALEPVPGVPGLLVLPSGPPPPNPSELLSTKTVQSKLEALSRSADYVVIDSPPLLPVSDSVVIAGLADLTLLVVTARTTARRSVARSIEMLEQVHAPLGGVVFNGVGQEGTYGYGYGYGYTAYAPRPGRPTSPLPTENGASNGASNGTRPANGSAESNGHGHGHDDAAAEPSSTPAAKRR